MEKISYHSNIQKNDKRCINNYRPVSLLPICGKIFERILYNPLFLYLESNDLLTPHQSRFHPNDSCIYQLLSIVHSIYADFDHNPSRNIPKRKLSKFINIAILSTENELSRSKYLVVVIVPCS